MKYLITGAPGSGKTSITDELARRGLTAYNSDIVSHHIDLRTGKPLNGWPPIPIDHKRYSWNWDVGALKKLLTSADPVFVSGITGNTLENLDLFDKIFALSATNDTLRHRLLTRTNNAYGKHPEELAQILTNNEGSEDFWRAKGCTIIDANRPLAQVVDALLAHTHDDD